MQKPRIQARTILAYSVATATGFSLTMGCAWYAQLRSLELISLAGGFLGMRFFRDVILALLGRRDPWVATKVCGVMALLGAGTGGTLAGVGGALVGTACAICLGFLVLLLTVPDRRHAMGGTGCRDTYVKWFEVGALALSVIVASMLAGLCLRQQFRPGLVFPSVGSPVHIVAIWESITLVIRGTDSSGNPLFSHLTVPYYYALPMSLLPSALVYIRWKVRRRWPNISACDGCGYNLVGNVSGVCPECGKAVIEELGNEENARDFS